MRITAVLIAILFINTASGQPAYKFHSQNYAGLLAGEATSSFQLQSINGFQKGTWFGGIGTGLDYYFYKSIPLFLSFTKYFTPEDRSFFISADGGTNFVWDNSTGSRVNGFRSDGKFSPSLYFGASAGYKVGLKNKRDAILLNIGYSAKYIEEKYKTSLFCLTPPCPEYYEKLHYRLNRLSLKVGWLF